MQNISLFDEIFVEVVEAILWPKASDCHLKWRPNKQICTKDEQLSSGRGRIVNKRKGITLLCQQWQQFDCNVMRSYNVMQECKQFE